MATAAYTRQRKWRYKKAALLVEIIVNPDVSLYLSDDYRTVTNEYEGLLETVSGMSEYLPVDGKFRHRGSATLKIANKKLSIQHPGYIGVAEQFYKFSDYLATHNLIGCKVIIKQYFDDLALTDCETVFTGWITHPIKYDEQYIYLIAESHRQTSLIPSDLISADEYSDLGEKTATLPFPLVYGKIDNTLTAGDTGDLTDYGGALTIDTEIDDANHYWLGGGHRCNDIVKVCAHGGSDPPGTPPTDKTSAITKYIGAGNQGGGPAWRDICYFEPSNWTVSGGEDTMDIHGMESYGDLLDDPGSGTLLENPCSCFEETVRTFLGWTDDDIGSSFSDTSDCDSLKCWGVINRQNTYENLAAFWMSQFPIWFYHGRDGKLEYKKWNPNPSVDYTERMLSYDDDIKLLNISTNKTAYNSIYLNFWRNLGIDCEGVIGVSSWWQREKGGPYYEQTVTGAGKGNWFSSAFIKLRVQYSGKLLDGALNTTDKTFDIDTGGIDPQVAVAPHDLIMIDREIMECSSYSAGSLTVYNRGILGTTATSHADDTAIYYLRLGSDDGGGYPIGRGRIDLFTNSNTIYIDEGGGVASAVDIATRVHSWNDPNRWADDELALKITNDVTLAGTYEGSWDAETGKFTLSADTTFKIDVSECDELATVLGFTEDTAIATSCTSDSIAYTREWQAAYAYACHGVNNSYAINADFIRGNSLDYGAPADRCDTAVELLHYLFDYYHRPRKRVEFESSLVLADLELGQIVEFNTDIDNHLKCHGASWSSLKWRVIEIHRPTMYSLKFLVEEA
jgi:hypothetical protein